jgi:hypothetical protein
MDPNFHRLPDLRREQPDEKIDPEVGPSPESNRGCKKYEPDKEISHDLLRP